MEAVHGMHMEQSKGEMRGLQCVHSNAAMKFFPCWDDHWTIDDIEDTDLSYQVFCNQDIKVQTFCDEGRFLAAIQTDGDVTLLFTVGKKQKFPLCSRVNCSKQVKCICHKKYKSFMKDGESDQDQESLYYWNKRTGRKPVLVEHFLDRLPGEGYNRKHGYNRTEFEYPVKRCKDLQDKFLDRLKDIYDMPNSIVPVFDKDETCDDHGHEYNPDDQKLVLVSPNLTIYTESCDKILPIATYGRPTIGGCKCVLQADTHNLLLWNMGSGHLVDYLFLHNHIHKMVSSGLALNASFNARKTSLSSIGLKSSLSYVLFLCACTGYTQMIQFRKEDFLCSTCGDSPSLLANFRIMILQLAA
jgi:hypothetical protein